MATFDLNSRATCLIHARFERELKMEFNMLASAKWASIAAAVILALVVPLVPTVSASAASSPAVENRAPLRNGDLVRLRSGGPLMTVVGVDGDQANCVWTDFEGNLASERLPMEALEPAIRIIGGFRRPIPDPS
jgi:uncharacterized protein YodC (DUF2158 family)